MGSDSRGSCNLPSPNAPMLHRPEPAATGLLIADRPALAKSEKSEEERVVARGEQRRRSIGFVGRRSHSYLSHGPAAHYNIYLGEGVTANGSESNAMYRVKSAGRPKPSSPVSAARRAVVDSNGQRHQRRGSSILRPRRRSTCPDRRSESTSVPYRKTTRTISAVFESSAFDIPRTNRP